MILTPIFVITMMLSFIYTLSTDRLVVKKLSKRDRQLYYGINGLVLAMLVTLYFGIRIPTPFRLITYKIAPFVYELLKSTG